MKFSKIHGLGNDYIYVDARKLKLHNINDLARKISDRHLGVGSDGLILLLESRCADYRMRIFNADGSEAEMCGNGIRGLAKYIYENNISKENNLTIETNCGIKELKLNTLNGKVISVTVDMGKVSLIDRNCLFIGNERYDYNYINVGNPHLVIFTDNIKNINLQYIGPKLENHPLFPNRTNVEFVQIIDNENIVMRVWERGSGETLACGTGAVASVASGVLNNKLNKNCKVHLKYGVLNIYFNEDTYIAYLTGTVTKVFDGEINIKKMKRTKLK